MQGWVKLHRCLLQKHIFDNEKLLKVHIWCLLKAHHFETKQQIGRQIVWVKPGQFVTGRYKAAAELNMPPSTAWSYLKLLEDNNTINIKSNNKFSVVTIVNWNSYQSYDKENDSKVNSKQDNKWTTNGQQMDTYKNDKNDKNIYILTDTEKEFLDVLASIENYPFDRKKDLEMFNKLQERYPNLDLIEAIKDFAQYKLDNPLSKKSNARSQINNSFKKYVEWGRNLKKQMRDTEEQEILI